MGKKKDKPGGKGTGGARGFEKKGNPTRVCEREGPLCTCEGRGAVSESRKNKKEENKTNHKKKLKKSRGCRASSMGVERRIPEQDARRCRVMPKARRKGACPRASGRRGSRRVARKAGGEGNRQACVCEREGIPHAPVREKTVSREQERKKEEGGASQSVVQKGEGGVVSKKKGDGEARENDLESFQSFRRIKSQPWELPQKCHVTYS